MITFFTGKPGDGKSLYGTAKILKLLVEGEVYVVTNIPLNPPQVCAYVAEQRAKKNDERPFDFDSSVRVLKDEEVYEFYRRRSGGLVLPQSPDFQCDVRERLDRPEFVAKMKESFLTIKQNPEWCRPVWYFIDEAHNFFSAREWASAGRGMLYYASQHRHLHDQIFFITQVVDNVEKQLRGLASELHRIRNHMRRSVGPFKMRPCFKVDHFYGCPGDQTNSTPFNRETFFLDPAGVAGCYQTVGALGVQGKPEKVVNAGILPWWLLWVVGFAAVIAVAGAFLGLPFMGSFFAKKFTTGSVQTLPQKTPQGEPRSQKLDETKPPIGAATTVVASAPDQEKRPQEIRQSDLYVVSITMGNRRANVALSDGTVHTEDDGTIKKLRRNSVEMRDGRTLYLRQPIQGSGVKGTPVRPDAAQRLGDGAPVVVPAIVSSQSGTSAGNSSVAASASTAQPQTPPLSGNSAQLTVVSGSSWRTDSDGVQRLVHPDTLTH